MHRMNLLGCLSLAVRLENVSCAPRYRDAKAYHLDDIVVLGQTRQGCGWIIRLVEIRYDTGCDEEGRETKTEICTKYQVRHIFW
jgi:hypothetical protein